MEPEIIEEEPLKKSKSMVEQDDMVEIEFVSPSSELKEPVKLKVSKSISLGEVKLYIERQHPEKPPRNA